MSYDIRELLVPEERPDGSIAFVPLAMPEQNRMDAAKMAGSVASLWQNTHPGQHTLTLPEAHSLIELAVYTALCSRPR